MNFNKFAEYRCKFPVLFFVCFFFLSQQFLTQILSGGRLLRNRESKEIGMRLSVTTVDRILTLVSIIPYGS